MNSENKTKSKESDIKTRSREKDESKNDAKKERNKNGRLAAPVKFVGSADDIIPFAWRNPLTVTEIKKASKKFRALTIKEAERASRMLLPIENDESR